MATSRYAAAGSVPTTTNITKNENTSGSSNTSSSGTNSSSTDSSQNTNSTNMDPRSLAALENLIRQLQGGGTAGMRQDKAAQDAEVAKVQQQRNGYSKENAFNDAQGLMAQTMRLALEKAMPGINSGALGAGASQSSMRALLTQKAAENAAEAASAQGLQAAVNYGGVANGMNNTIANLLGIQDPAAAALINALGVAKGAVTNSSTTGSSTTNGTTTSTGTTNTANTSNTTGVSTAAPTAAPAQQPLYWGPIDDGINYAARSQATTNQALADLVTGIGGGSFSNNYTF